MDKFEFCNKLCELLQQTEQHKNLKALTYYTDPDGDEWVRPFWEHDKSWYAGRSICVTADSETAIIKDVLRGIE